MFYIFIFLLIIFYYIIGSRNKTSYLDWGIEVSINSYIQLIYDQLMKYIENIISSNDKLVINNIKLMVDKITSSSGKDYYLYGDKHENALFNINLPIAIQIQDFSNIYFKRMIDKLGGKLLWRKTDCCLIHHSDDYDDDE